MRNYVVYIGYCKTAEQPFATYQLYIMAADSAEAAKNAMAAAPKILPEALACWIHSMSLNNGNLQ